MLIRSEQIEALTADGAHRFIAHLLELIRDLRPELGPRLSPDEIRHAIGEATAYGITDQNSVAKYCLVATAICTDCDGCDGSRLVPLMRGEECSEGELRLRMDRVLDFIAAGCQ